MLSAAEKSLPQSGSSLWDWAEAVISVPHSGTRSLCLHLFGGYDSYPYVHFGEADLSQFSGVAHIPIRNPVDIAVSWESRGRRDTDDLLCRLQGMVDFAQDYGRAVLHRIEEIPRYEWSVGPDSAARKARSSVMIDAVMAWMKDNEQFYERLARP